MGLTLASGALGGLHAPAWAWFAAAILAMLCFVRAAQLHFGVDRQSEPQSLAEQQREAPVFVAAEAEIALAREEALEMAKLLRVEWPYLSVDGALVETALPDWRAKTTDFIGTVLGAAQRAAFKASEAGSDLLERLESEGGFLGDLAVNLSADSIRVNEAEFLEARTKRRDHDAARFLDYNHERAPGAPPPVDRPVSSDDSREFGRRDDRGELAKRCHMLAGSIERWVQNVREEEEPAVAKIADELHEKADLGLERAEARREAQRRFERIREIDFERNLGLDARELFVEAWQMGVIAKEHEQLAAEPLAIEFDKVPKLFNEIADRLYQVAA